MKSFFKILLLFLVLAGYPSQIFADWINLTGAENARNIVEIYVEKDRVKIKLEVFVEDLLLFQELIPDQFFSKPFANRPGLEERLTSFADQTFQIVTDSGEKLSAALDLVEPRFSLRN